MADVDDSDLWAESALRYAELAAQQIAHFRNPWWKPPWQELIPDSQPSVPSPPPAHPPSDSSAEHLLPSDPPPDAAPARPESEFIVAVFWGSRGKRSRQSGHKGARAPRRAEDAAGSPETPLDFGGGSGSGSGSGSSTSGGDDGSSSPEKATKRRRPGEPYAVIAGGGQETKVVSTEPGPMVFRFPPSKSIRRQGKKKTIIELQEEEKLLLEEMRMLRKEVELKRRAHEASLAENKRLKNLMLSLQSQIVPDKVEKVHSQQIQTSGESSHAPSCSQIMLPDLNEPLSENLD